jgi:hypothetical protein
VSCHRRWIVRLIVYPGLVLGALAFLFVPRGDEVLDGRNDRGRNAIWLQHDRLPRLAHFGGGI